MEPHAKVAKQILAAGDDGTTGPNIMSATGIKSGHLYPLLHRWTAAGHVTGWYPVSPDDRERPVRRYRATESGVPALQDMVL